MRHSLQGANTNRLE